LDEQKSKIRWITRTNNLSKITSRDKRKERMALREEIRLVATIEREERTTIGS
jgi:hypothetical protein